MKRLIMINGDDLRQVQGINYVIDHFVKGKKYLKDIELSKIYGVQTVDVAAGEQMPISSDAGTMRYTTKRKFRSFLREMLSSKHYAFAMLKYYLNCIRPTKIALSNYLRSGKHADFILFHGILGAYYYYKKHNGKVPEKCALIVHAVDDEMGQFFDTFPAFIGRKQKEILAYRDYVYEHIDKVVYISRKAYDNSKMPESRKCVIYNGIDDILYDFSEKTEGMVNFVCVGSMSGWKGQELIIQALSKLDKEHIEKIHLYFVGDGAEKNNLEQQARDSLLEDYVTFMGDRKDVSEILRSQDVFIMPSKSEGLSIATIEAIRAGLFMLLTDTGGNKEVMGNEGFVIERDADDIKNKICKIVDEHLISKEQKERSRQHFLELFTTEKFITSYEKMFMSL